jgi:O-antigen ligase
VARATRNQRIAPGALVLAAVLPILFVHVRYQPSVGLGFGGASAKLSDAAVLAIALAATWEGRRSGFSPLRAGRWLWITAGVYLALVFAATAWGTVTSDSYTLLPNLVTAAKLAEYALLAPALPLLLRRREDFLLLFWTVALLAVVATAVGALQFIGVLGDLDNTPPGRRKPSFVGYHDFAALSAAALALAFAAAAFGRAVPRRLAWLGGVSGVVGLVLSGALASIAAMLAAALAAALVAARRGSFSRRGAGAIALAAAVVTLGGLAMRTADIDSFLRFLGVSQRAQDASRVQTYSHRTLLAYIGIRIFLDHPLAGVGWQASDLPENFNPYLPAAHRRFPSVPAVAFPSADHPWGVQNGIVQTLAEMGVLGFAALVGLFGAGFLLAGRVAVRGPPERAATALIAFVWLLAALAGLTAIGLVAGIPANAVLWLALGVTATVASVDVPEATI